MTKAIKIEHCTSCGSKNIKVDGNQYYCPDCDKTAKVTEQGTKVIDKNPLGKEKARIDQLEDDVAELKGHKEPEPDPIEPGPGPAEPKSSDDEDTDPKPFVTW